MVAEMKEYLKLWEKYYSTSQASKQTGISAGGYKWKYKDG